MSLPRYLISAFVICLRLTFFFSSILPFVPPLCASIFTLMAQPLPHVASVRHNPFSLPPNCMFVPYLRGNLEHYHHRLESTYLCTFSAHTPTFLLDPHEPMQTTVCMAFFVTASVPREKLEHTCSWGREAPSQHHMRSGWRAHLPHLSHRAKLSGIYELASACFLLNWRSSTSSQRTLRPDVSIAPSLRSS